MDTAKIKEIISIFECSSLSSMHLEADDMKITLKKEKSADGITYSRAAFAFVSKLTDEQRAETKAMVEMIKAQADNIPDIDEADYNTGAAVDAADFQSVDGDANLPFN